VVGRDWWKSAVVYQVYARSFADSDGDGVGDLGGILDRLDYLESLGVDVVWLSPVYRSPMADNGYDISDYHEVDPLFGTPGQLDELVAKLEFGQRRRAGRRSRLGLLALPSAHRAAARRALCRARDVPDAPRRRSAAVLLRTFLGRHPAAGRGESVIRR
jgi:hypothetical protein